MRSKGWEGYSIPIGGERSPEETGRLGPVNLTSKKVSDAERNLATAFMEAGLPVSLFHAIHGLGESECALVADFALALKRSAQTAPELYADRDNKNESAPAFVERVYGERGLLNGTFTRADLRRLDKQAYMGLMNWERSNGKAAINLPTLKERNDRLIEEAEASESPILRSYTRHLQSQRTYAAK